MKEDNENINYQTKDEILEGFRLAVREMEAIKRGDIPKPTKTVEEFLNGLK